MATPHIEANIGDFAKTVLMPGDPLRSQFIAENFLENTKLVNNVRGIRGYTGTYKGKEISVMASGMGMPSIGIYSYELFSFFGVENIIRVGSAGALRKDINLRDIVIAIGACTDSAYANSFNLPGTFAPTADYKALKTCTEEADKLGMRYHVGNVISSDVFYSAEVGTPFGDTPNGKWAKMGVLAVEMEAAALYMNAAKLGKHALAVCTISDNTVTGEELSSSERQSSFTDMITLALETAIRL
ncbi:MAG: purine-nucleoside phosphorylase [Eubacteriales bacterium]